MEMGERAMQTWKRLGDVIGRNIAVVSPVLVLQAVLFPDLFSGLVRLVPFMFAIITFQGSLGNDFHNLAEAFRHPLSLLITLAMAVLVLPLLAFLLGSLMFGDSPNLVAGVVLEYSVPVAVVSVMWIDMYAGNSSLGLATLLVSTVLSPVTIPLTLHVLLGTRVEVDALGMVQSMIVQIALPALAGTALNHLSDGWGKKTLSPAISPATRMMLCLVILANSTAAVPYLRSLTPQYVAAIAFRRVHGLRVRAGACGFSAVPPAARPCRDDRLPERSAQHLGGSGHRGAVFSGGSDAPGHRGRALPASDRGAVRQLHRAEMERCRPRSRCGLASHVLGAGRPVSMGKLPWGPVHEILRTGASWWQISALRARTEAFWCQGMAGSGRSLSCRTR